MPARESVCHALQAAEGIIGGVDAQGGGHDLGVELVLEHELLLVDEGDLLRRSSGQAAEGLGHGVGKPVADRGEVEDQCLAVLVLPETHGGGLALLTTEPGAGCSPKL